MKRPLAWNYEPIHILRDWKPKGVIHVGANDGEEFVYYKSMGVQNLMGFEPLRAPYERFGETHPDVLKYMVGWGAEDAKMTIEVTENDKASSTLPRIEVDNWEEHEVFKDWNMGQWPIVGTEEIQIVRFDNWVEYSKIDLNNYNFINMDIQGMELDGLKGMGDTLDYFDALVIECSEKPVFVGEHSAAEVSAWLAERGFEQVTRTMLHGDILFLRKDKIDG